MDEKGKKEREILRESFALNSMRVRSGFKAGDVAKRLRIASSSLGNYENGKYSPPLFVVVGLLSLYKPSMEEILELLDLKYLLTDDLSLSVSQQQKQYAAIFEGKRYFCYHYSNDGSGEMPCLQISPFESNDTVLTADAEQEEYEYSCTATVIKSASFAVLIFQSKGIQDDIAFFLIPFQKEVKHYFNVGIGVVLSLAVKSPELPVPSFQLMSIISEDYAKTLGEKETKEDGVTVSDPIAKGREVFKEMSKSYLMLPTLNSNSYSLQIANIRQLSYDLYEKVERTVNPKEVVSPEE